MRKVFVATILLLVVLSGCFSNRLPDTYQFYDAGQRIESIELLYNPYAQEGYTGKAFISIRALDQREIKPFIDKLHSLKTVKCITPPPSAFGEYVVVVDYENGDTEMFGSWHIEFVENGNSPSGVGAYCFAEQEAFEELFLSYADIGGRSTGDGSAVSSGENPIIPK